MDEGSLSACLQNAISSNFLCVQVNENGIFVTTDGMPIDREGLPIDGEINPTTGYIIGSDNSTTSMTFIGPNGVPLPELESLSPLLLVEADGVPRNASGTLLILHSILEYCCKLKGKKKRKNPNSKQATKL
jgi:hypothetical protein